MPSNQTTTVLDRLAAKMLARVRFAGLIHLFLDHGARAKNDGGGDRDSELSLFWEEFARVLGYMEEACHLLELDPIQLPQQPFVYNAHTFHEGEPWASDGSDQVSVSLQKLLSGYGALWKMQEDGPDGATMRIVKAAVWFAEAKKDKGAGFRLILSLFRAGFLSRRYSLGLAVAKLAKTFSADLEHSGILQLGFTEKDQDKANELVSREGFNPAFFSEIGGWLLDETRRSIRRARAAVSPDEWITRISQTAGLIAATEFFENQFKVMKDLPEPYRIQFLALEEIRCDFGACFFSIMREMQERAAMEESWDMASAMLKVQMLNGGTDAVDRLFSARLLLPDVLMEVIATKFPELKIDRDTDFLAAAPEAWKHYGPGLAHVAARLLGINHQIVRWSQIAAVDEGDAEPKPIDRNRAEFRAFIHPYEEAMKRGDDQSKRAIVEQVLHLYPNNELYLLESAILHDESGHSKVALEELMECICLDPMNWMPWQSLGVVCGKLGHQAERGAAKLISRVLEEKKYGSGT